MEESRPVSRRGSGKRSIGVVSEVRLQTASMRPQSSISQLRIPTSRLNTGLLPPKPAIMNSGDRPITQQGLSGMRTNTSQTHARQVFDKRYYEGLLRQKMKVIALEVQRLTNFINTQRQHEATADVYDARVKEVATELTQLQGELSDNNYVLDKVNTGGDTDIIVKETEQVRAENARYAAELERLYQQNRDFEQQIERADTQIQNEKNTAQRLLNEMQPADAERFMSMKKTNDELLAMISEHQQHLQNLKDQIGSLQEKVSNSQIKQDAVLLYQKLHEREERKALLEEELKKKETPVQEREQLLQRVREDNAEISAMERQMLQLQEKIKTQKQEVELIEQDLEESQTDRFQKLKELRQREDTMDTFLASFEEARDVELERIEKLETKVEMTLLEMSKNLQTPTESFPSKNEFALMKETLTLKQEELEKSHMTAEELSREESKLRENVLKVEALEEKINKETRSLREQMQQMKEEMKVLADLDALRSEAESRREELIKQRGILLQKKVPKEEVESLRKRHHELLKELNDNDTYVQLHTLEKKLLLLEESNGNTKHQMASRKNELNFEEQRSNALQYLNSYNLLLQKRCANRP